MPLTAICRGKHRAGCTPPACPVAQGSVRDITSGRVTGRALSVQEPLPVTVCQDHQRYESLRAVDQGRVDMAEGRVGAVAHQHAVGSHLGLSVRGEQERWRRTRQALNAARPELARLAARLYAPSLQLADTGLVAPPAWLPEQPIELSDIQLTYVADAPAPTLDGTEAATSHVRPRVSSSRRHRRYSHAIQDLARPALFEDRASWRLVELGWRDGKGEMTLGSTTYFAGIDTYEALAHELADRALDPQGRLRAPAPTMRDLPFRSLIGDPTDLCRRPVLPSIDTLTVRREAGAASFLLHRRDPTRVAVAGGMLQVIPAGIFQPSSDRPGAAEADFDLWRNLMREFAEELLGSPEYGDDGDPVRYDRGVFRVLEQARAEGRLRVFCLGFAADALTLVGEILTVLVIDAEVFDQLAAGFVDRNAEGAVVKRRYPFTEETIAQLLQDRIAPAAAGCLHLAWRHRDHILQWA